MEYGYLYGGSNTTTNQDTNVCGEYCNNNYYRFVGWRDSDSIKKYFSPNTVKMISKKVTELLQGVDEKK